MLLLLELLLELLLLRGVSLSYVGLANVLVCAKDSLN